MQRPRWMCLLPAVLHSGLPEKRDSERLEGGVGRLLGFQLGVPWLKSDMHDAESSKQICVMRYFQTPHASPAHK